MKPTNIKQLQIQSKRLQTRVVDRNTVAVTSVTNPSANHIVMVHFDADGTIHARCTCPWALNGGVACSHVLAALELLAAKKKRRLSFWLRRDEAERQRHRLFRLADNQEPDDGVWITSRKTA